MTSSRKSLPLTITVLNENGYGTGQKGGQTISVARTVPGDQVLIGPPHGAERWTRADLLSVTKGGPDRVPSGCRAFERGCGGCQWLHLAYPAQLAWKEKQLASLLHTRLGFRGKVHPLVAMTEPLGYRNKLSLKNQAGKLVFVPETDETPLAPDTCQVQTPALQAAWKRLRSWRVPLGIEQLHLRSNAQGQVGLHAFAKDRTPASDAALKELLAICPGAVGMGVTRHGSYHLVTGEAALSQTLGGLTWLIPHNGFFQTNEVQAGALLDVVRREARVTRSDRVLDLYCGAGFFGLALAATAHDVVGIEENSQSVEAALASARRSGIEQVRFLAGDLGAVLATVDVFPSEVAIVDPPREGLLPHALEALKTRRPRRIVYVSCYPKSLVRDVKDLVAAGWKTTACTPIDMFPHTSHVETVVTLER